MQLTAHRGFADEFPENTLAAVQAATRVADEIEIDVRRCGSGELVVFHDETLDRVTDAEGPVTDWSLEELRTVSVLGTDERIPTLSETIDLVPSDVRLNVELKDAEIAADAVDVVSGADCPILFSSFLPDAIEQVTETSDHQTALIFREQPDVNVERAVELGCERIHPKWWLVLRPRLVRRANDRGLSVHAWTIHHRVTARLLRRRGVDGVIADRSVVV